MGRYLTNQPYEDTFQPQASEGLDFFLKKKLQDQQQRQKLKEIVQEALLKGKVAKAGRTDYLTPGGDINMDAFNTDPVYDLERKGKIADAEKNIYEAGGPAPSYFSSGANAPQGGSPVLGRQPNGGMSLEPTKFDAFGRPKEFIDPQQESDKLRNQEIIKGPAEGAVGKIALARESLKNLGDIENKLYPNGNLNRELALRSNMPGVSLPFLGRLTPQVSPDNPIDPTDDTKAGTAQDIFREMSSALSGRQLIQTGVAARPEETAKLVAQFAPGVFSNSDSSKRGLHQLKDFYGDYLNTADPSQRLSGKNVLGGNQQQSNSVPSFNSESEVESAGLPDGTPIIVNGRHAIYRR